MFLLDSDDQIEVSQAKAKELQEWKQYNVYTGVDNEGQDYITTRWVITEKFIDNNRIVKARLVGCGFEEEDQTTLRKDSAICGKEYMQISLAIAVSMKWQVNSVDIRASILQGKQINRNILIKPPKRSWQCYCGNSTRLFTG